MSQPCCAICNAPRNLTSHHIHPREYKDSYPNGPENINERANIVIICAGCHAAIHDKRAFHQMIRDIKTKLRRKIRTKDYQNEEQRVQSLKDREIQRLVWQRLVQTLQDPYSCRIIEEYRRILRLVQRIHTAYYAHKTII